MHIYRICIFIFTSDWGGNWPFSSGVNSYGTSPISPTYLLHLLVPYWGCQSRTVNSILQVREIWFQFKILNAVFELLSCQCYGIRNTLFDYLNSSTFVIFSNGVAFIRYLNANKNKLFMDEKEKYLSQYQNE